MGEEGGGGAAEERGRGGTPIHLSLQAPGRPGQLRPPERRKRKRGRRRRRASASASSSSRQCRGAQPPPAGAPLHLKRAAAIQNVRKLSKEGCFKKPQKTSRRGPEAGALSLQSSLKPPSQPARLGPASLLPAAAAAAAADCSQQPRPGYGEERQRGRRRKRI